MTETAERTWTHEGRPALNRMGIPPVDGPWMNEPDKIHWIDSATNLDCLMVRNPMGAWCGYVAIDDGHPWFAKGYGECIAECGDGGCYQHSPEGLVSVHGGLTYADFCAESDQGEGYGICHTPLAGRPDRVWWFGFDCVHAGDLSPYDAAKAAHEQYRYPWNNDLGDVYRDVAYVKQEVASLAQQLAEVSA